MTIRSNEIVLGIDFGTTYSSAAAVLNGRVEFVLDQGEKSIPSIVHISSNHSPEVGFPALRHGATDPSNTVFSVKRLLGQSVDSPEARQMDVGYGHRIIAGPQNMAVLLLRGQEYAPTQIAGYILTHFRDLALRRFGGRINKAVMTIPADASDAYCQALHQAAGFAGLEIIRLVAEPVAGALALGKNMKPADRQMVICDFGGGTFDTTWTVQRGHDFASLAVSGDPFLGGNDFDHKLAEAVAGHIFRYTGYKIQNDIVRWSKLNQRCEMAKRRLSFVKEITLKMTDAYTVKGREHDINLPISRRVMESRWASLLESTTDVLKKLFDTAERTKNDIDEVLLIGGTSLIPAVQQTISQYVGKRSQCTPDADVVVTIGAAMLAGAS